MTHSPHTTFAHYFQDANLAPFFYALSKKMQEGNVCIAINELPQDKEFWVEYGEIDLSKVQFVENTNLVGATHDENKPFVLNNNRLYIGRNHFYETRIVEKLKELSQIPAKEVKERIELLNGMKDFVQARQSKDNNIDDFEPDEKPDWQLIAAIQGFLKNITIITGGPGTGKTTTVAKILALHNQQNQKLNIALTAPTGKAAARMKESLLSTIQDKQNQGLGIQELVAQLNPMTLHRLLGSQLNSPFFKHNKDNPLPYDLVIVDESSMVGLGLFAKLLDALKDGSRLILLGDSEQLASVDTGSLFGDLCKGLEASENKFSADHWQFLNSFLDPKRQLNEKYKLQQPLSFLDECLVRLKKTYRYEQKSKMGQFTKAVIQGKSDELESILQNADNSLILDENYDEKTFTDFVKQYKNYLDEADINKAIDELNKLRVLCAVRQGDQGV